MNSRTFRIANLISLQRAVLCVNCEIISEGLNGRCDACGGQALLNLKGILGEAAEFAPEMVYARPPLFLDDLVRLGELLTTAA